MSKWTPEQQREHRRLWVEALRSGTYQQARHRLHTVEGFCCLGVACDISGLGEWQPSSEVATFRYLDGADSCLPGQVRNWLGVEGSLGGFGHPESPRTYLADLNDSGKPFAEIADIIESEPEGLLSQAASPNPTEPAS